MEKAERFRTELLKRGVLLVPVIWDESKEPKLEKKGFGASSKATSALPSIGVRREVSLLRFYCEHHPKANNLTRS